MSKKNKSSDIPRLPDVRLFEKDIINVGKYLGDLNPKNEDEVKNGIEKYINDPNKNIHSKPKGELSDFDRAYEYIYKALENNNPVKKIELAQKALTISPDVIEAYNILAENTDDLEKQKELYETAITNGKRFLGDEFFESNKGHFWGIIETRPYMRALMGYVNVLWMTGEMEKTLQLLCEILEYNPTDNMGARYPLISNLLYFKRLKDVIKLLEEFKDDDSIHWNYSYALYYYFKGDKLLANKNLKSAIKNNPYFGDFLFGIKELPAENFQFVSPGSETEALEYYVYGAPVWLKYKSATDWLMKEHVKQYVDPISGLIKLPDILS